MAQSDELTIRVQTVAGGWQTIGADQSRGIEPEQVHLEADQHGPSTASFTLRRDPGSTLPDLSTYTPVEVEVAGQVVWSGRIKETPITDGDDAAVSVAAEGWQYHLDDDAYVQLYVGTAMSDLKDGGTYRTADLNVWTRVATVTTDAAGLLGFGYAGDGTAQSTTWVSGKFAGVMMDQGADARLWAKRVVLNIRKGAGSPGAVQLYLRAGSSAGAISAGPLSDAIAGLAFGSLPTAFGTFTSGTFATPYRYLSLFLYNNGANYVATGEDMAYVQEVRRFGNTAWESAGASILKASDVIRDALNQATSQLSSDRSLIASTSFNIPDFVVGDPKTPREVVEAVNAFHDYRYKVGVDKRFMFQPKPSTAAYVMGTWAGAVFNDASANSGEDVYNKVIVTGAGPDGEAVSVTRTATGTAADDRGFSRTKILPINAPTNDTVATQIGDVFLLGHKKTPFKGSIIATMGGIRRVTGGDVHPAWLLRDTTEKIRVSHRVDPDTGALGRDGTIAQVVYEHDSRTATVTLDSTRTSFEAYLERLSAVTSAALPH